MTKLYILHLKKTFHNKISLLIMLFIFLVCIYLVFQLSANATEKSSIPIGMINLDQSEEANDLYKSIKEQPVFYVYEGKEEKLLKLLNDEMIQGVFVINKGYGDAIHSGNTKDLVTLFYLKENQSVKILSDIFAGDMLYDICLNKSYNLYKKTLITVDEEIIYKDKVYNQEEFRQYTDTIRNATKVLPTFDIRAIEINKGALDINSLNNSYLYFSILCGIIAMLIGFLAMYLSSFYVLEKEEGVMNRILISPLTPLKVLICYFLIGISVTGSLSIILDLVLKETVNDITAVKGLSLLGLMLIYCIVTQLWFALLSWCIRRFHTYQIFGIISCFVFGIGGFLNILSGLMHVKILNISKIVPNSWFIKGFIDIIISKSLQDIPYSLFVLPSITILFLIFAISVAGICKHN